MPDLEGARWRVARHYLAAARGVKERQRFKEVDPDWPQVEGVLVWLGEAGGPEWVDLFSELVAELSEYWRTRGMGREMVGWCEEAARVCAAAGRRGDEGAHLGNLGNAYWSLGQVERAIEHHQAAMEISREIGDRRGEGAALGNLGLAYADLGQVERAIEQYQAALVIQREIGDRRGEGAALGNLGLAYAALGQVERARGFVEQALAIFEEIRSPSAEQARRLLARLSEEAN